MIIFRSTFAVLHNDVDELSQQLTETLDLVGFYVVLQRDVLA